MRKARRLLWPGLAMLAALVLLAPGCEPNAERTAAGAGDIGRPYAELEDVARVVAEARSILPRIPADVEAPALAPPDAPPAPAPRQVLVGEARLLRPGRFPDLPPRMEVAVYLDERRPPGGHLRVTDGSGTATWPVLDAVATGRRDAAFAITLRVADPAARLRYLVLLGVPYEVGGRGYRAFEGYLIHPNAVGGVATTGPVYPVDFGYRHPEPPEPVIGAAALSERIRALRSLFAEWEALGTRIADLQAAAERLRGTDVPADQRTQQLRDLQDYADRIAAHEAERAKAAQALRTALRAAYRERTALAAAWEAFTQGNAYRWRTPAERRAAYRPLQALRADYPTLERIYTALEGDADGDLREARTAMEAAILREQEVAPVAE